MQPIYEHSGAWHGAGGRGLEHALGPRLILRSLAVKCWHVTVSTPAALSPGAANRDSGFAQVPSGTGTNVKVLPDGLGLSL